MSDTHWQTCKQAGVVCPICGNSDRCTVSPDGTAFKCWRDGGKVHQTGAKPVGRTQRPDDYGRHSKPKGERRTFLSATQAIAGYGKGEPSATWSYHNAQGEPVLTVARWNKPDGGKDIRPAGRMGAGWIMGDPQGPFPLYRLPDLLAVNSGETVFVCEGEKATDAAAGIGLLATTSAHGSSSAAETDWTPLAPFSRICILPDNDEPGEKYAAKVTGILLEQNPKADVRVVRLPGLPPAGDFVEYMEAMDSKDDADIRQGVIDQFEAAPSADNGTVKPYTLGRLLAEFPNDRDDVVDGLIRQREVTMFVSASKAGKSHIVDDLILSVASGGWFLDTLKCRKGKVILIDNELFPETIAKRFKWVAEKKGISLDEVANQIEIYSLRGRWMDLRQIRRMLWTLQPGEVDLIVLDSLYRTIPQGIDENANADLTVLMNDIDQLAMHVETAIVAIGHNPKGDTSDRSVVDLVAGAGAITRACDNIVAFRQHEVDGCFIVQAKLRDHKECTPFVIEKVYPIFQPRPDLSPDDIYRPSKSNRGHGSPAKLKAEIETAAKERLWTPERFTEEVVGAGWKSKDKIEHDAVTLGMKASKARQLLQVALEDNLVVESLIKGTGSPKRYQAAKALSS